MKNYTFKSKSQYRWVRTFIGNTYPWTKQTFSDNSENNYDRHYKDFKSYSENLRYEFPRRSSCFDTFCEISIVPGDFDDYSDNCRIEYDSEDIPEPVFNFLYDTLVFSMFKR